MASSRSAHVRLISILVYFLLCFAVVMQMLGTPTSLWTLEFETDLVEASLFEELSLPQSHVVLFPDPTTHQRFELSNRVHSLLLEETLFRPPSCPYPFMPIA
jgi:hypothetical protein